MGEIGPLPWNVEEDKAGVFNVDHVFIYRCNPLFVDLDDAVLQKRVRVAITRAEDHGVNLGFASVFKYDGVFGHAHKARALFYVLREGGWEISAVVTCNDLQNTKEKNLEYLYISHTIQWIIRVTKNAP